MIEIRTTQDGSHTLFVPGLNEHYHSYFGAVQESKHVFIDAGLRYFSNHGAQLNILEVGFGTGLNALLTALEPKGFRIHYLAIEAFPVKSEIIHKLNFPTLLEDKKAEEIFTDLHKLEWEKDVNVEDDFILKKVCSTIQDVPLPENQIDLIYFDAFAPEVQPELWTVPIFEKLFACLKSGGILVTYSSKGLVKQNLRLAGFTVKRLPGPPGKRHMLRALKV